MQIYLEKKGKNLDFAEGRASSSMSDLIRSCREMRESPVI
jgi:hypothetical protein